MRDAWNLSHSRDGFAIAITRKTRRAGIYSRLCDWVCAIEGRVPEALQMSVWRVANWCGQREELNTVRLARLPIDRETARLLCSDDEYGEFYFQTMCNVEDSDVE